MKWMHSGLLATLTTLTVLAGCSRLVDNPQAQRGTYVLEGGSAADTLVLREDGRYVRRCPSGGGTRVEEGGTWEVDRSSGEPRVVLSDFQPTWQGNRAPGTSAIRGYWSTYAKRKRGGRIILEADEVHDIAYVRQAGER